VSEHGKEKAAVSTAAPVKTYTIEQFMNNTKSSGNAFSPDGKKILYSSNVSGIYNAWEVPVSGGEARPLTDSKTNSVFALSYFPNDERILYSSDQGGNEINHLYMRSPDGKVSDLTPDSAAKADFAGWSFDKKSFFYRSNKRDPATLISTRWMWPPLPRGWCSATSRGTTSPRFPTTKPMWPLTSRLPPLIRICISTR
jgi:Tol biopolymer transport system component